MYRHLPPAQAVAESGVSGGAGSGTAGQGLPGAPLPDPHLDILPVQDLDKLGVRPVREHGVGLKQRADLLDLQTVYVVAPDHRVGVAHGHTGHSPLSAPHLDRHTDDFRAQAHHWDVLRRH